MGSANTAYLRGCERPSSISQAQDPSRRFQLKLKTPVEDSPVHVSPCLNAPAAPNTVDLDGPSGHAGPAAPAASAVEPTVTDFHIDTCPLSGSSSQAVTASVAVGLKQALRTEQSPQDEKTAACSDHLTQHPTLKRYEKLTQYPRSWTQSERLMEARTAVAEAGVKVGSRQQGAAPKLWSEPRAASS